MSLEFESENYQLRRCFYEVQNEVGFGRPEEAYHQACKLWFLQHGLPVVSKLPHPMYLQGELVHSLFPDFVGWNSISVELKALSRQLLNSEFVQLFEYLKLRGDRLGLLVNMGMVRVQIERIVYDPVKAMLLEDWDAWSSRIDGRDREIGHRVRSALRSVFAEHSTGYGNEVTLKLFQRALLQQNLLVQQNPSAKCYFRGSELLEAPLDCVLIEDRLLVVLSALSDDNRFNILRGESYLKALGINWGVAVNFGKTKAEVAAIRLDPRVV